MMSLLEEARINQELLRIGDLGLTEDTPNDDDDWEDTMSET